MVPTMLSQVFSKSPARFTLDVEVGRVYNHPHGSKNYPKEF